MLDVSQAPECLVPPSGFFVLCTNRSLLNFRRIRYEGATRFVGMILLDLHLVRHIGAIVNIITLERRFTPPTTQKGAMGRFRGRMGKPMLAMLC